MRLNDGRALPIFRLSGAQRQAATIYGDGKQTRSFCYSRLIEGIHRNDVE